MNEIKRPALSRTWATVTTYRECGVVIKVAHDSVTLSRADLAAPLSTTLTAEVLPDITGQGTGAVAFRAESGR